MARRGKRRGKRSSSAAAKRTTLGIVPRRGRPDTERGLERRLERIRRGLYEVYRDLRYFTTSPVEHRERLRRAIHWPDVGHITSLARALVEEQRFAEWVRFNGLVRSA